MTVTNAISRFFYPENIAVIGVSSKKTNLGKNIVSNLMNYGYQGEILSIGPEEGIVFGQRIYQSLDQIDHPIDLAVILTPAKTVPSILDECGRNGIHYAVIESGGFSEMGGDRVALEEACTAAAKRHNIRFVGPNGIGLINIENGLSLPFMPMRIDLPLGKVSILAQSGGVGLSYMNFMADENIGINKFVSMGNKLNVTENDLLSYLIEDPGTEIILMYLEGFTDGRKFIEIASGSKKPILVHKSNRFQASAKIAQSHTAALFTDDLLVDHALEQAGCVRVNTLSDAMDYIKILTLPPIKGNRLAIVSRSGGHAVITADACAHYGFVLPPFPDEFLRRIENRVRAKVIRLQNPLDLGDLFDLTFYEEIIEETLKHEDLDGVLLCHAYRQGYEQEDSRNLVKKVEDLVNRYKKPVAIVIFTEAVEMAYLKKHSNLPVFFAPENAMRAIHLSHEWASRVKKPYIPSIRKTRSPEVENILKNADDRSFLYLSESFELLSILGFPIPEYFMANNYQDAVNAWEFIGKSIVMKINRPHISHKSDEGLIKMDLNSENDIREAFEEFQMKLNMNDPEVLLQPMISHGREIILGGKQDPIFGPVLLFGLGGIFVEALKDVIWRLAPIDSSDTSLMIKGIKGRNILEGMRGEKPVDTATLEKLLIKLSGMLEDYQEIKEIDINPIKLFTLNEGAALLDARIILKSG